MKRVNGKLVDFLHTNYNLRGNDVYENLTLDELRSERKEVYNKLKYLHGITKHPEGEFDNVKKLYYDTDESFKYINKLILDKTSNR